MNISSKKLAYIAWACVSSFYLFQFIIRVSPSVMMHDIMCDFQIDAFGFGTLCSLALYAYSLLQIPSGVLSDSFGTKKIVLTSLLFCIFGTLFFAYSPQLWLAQVGRVLIGVGSAAAFLSCSRVIVEWFPQSKRAQMFALSMSLGIVGGLFGGAPLAKLSDAFGWRQSLIIVCVMGFAVFLANAFFLKSPKKENEEKQKASKTDNHLSLKTQILMVFRSKQTWINALVALGMYIAIVVLSDLWGTAYLMQAYVIEKASAARISSLIYVGLIVGSLAMSFVSDRLQKRKAIILPAALLNLVLIACVVYLPLPLNVTSVIFFMIGFGIGAEMLCFVGATESVSQNVAGTATGFVNFIVMFFGAIIQQLVGHILDNRWTGALTSDGVRIYSAADFKAGFLPMLFVAVLSFVLSFFLKDNISKDREV